MNTQKILMVLTSHRLDCFRLCMDMLLHGGSIRRFDRVVLLLNGVRGRHLRYVHRLLRTHPEIPWDIISGPRGRGKFISGLQNQCVEKYPDALYFKIDEDTFVSANWDMMLTEAYQAYQHDPLLSLVSAVIPNNGLGCWYLLNQFPNLRDDFLCLPHAKWDSACNSSIWFYPHLATWMIRTFLDLEEGNRKLRETIASPFFEFHRRFSINCIAYDYRHWKEIGGVQEQDEVGWGAWIEQHNKTVVLATRALVHHYTFFNQQDWLDRSSLLEDLRTANVPTTPFQRSWLGRIFPRMGRIWQQIPSLIRRRLTRSN